MGDARADLPITVTAVLTAYNRADTIEDAIASVAAQTYPVAEIVVVDDCSTDKTVEIVGGLSDPRIRLVRRAANGGPAAANNSGIRAATSEIVALLDSDDLWLPDKIEAQLDAWRAAPDGDRLVICTRAWAEGGDEPERLEPKVLLRPEENPIDYLFVRSGMLQTSTLLLPRTLAIEVGFDERTRRHTDPGFVIRLHRSGARFVLLEQGLVRWRSVAGVERVSRAPTIAPSLVWLRYFYRLMTLRSLIAFLGPHLGLRALPRHPIFGALLISVSTALGGMDPGWAAKAILSRWRGDGR